MPTLAEVMILQSQLAQIQVIIASGLTRGSYEGKSTEFRTMTELYRIRDDLSRQLGLVAPVRRTVAAYNGGF